MRGEMSREAEIRNVSRQRIWQQRKIAEGRCQVCGCLREGKNALRCEQCRVKYNRLQILRQGRKRKRGITPPG